MRLSITLLITFVLVISFGCSDPPPKAPSTAAAKPLLASKLRVLVVDDPQLQAGLELLRGEWSERSGGELQALDVTQEQLLDSERVDADLVIYPSRIVGTLVSREWIRPVRSSVLESEEVGYDGLYPLIRDQVLKFDNQVYGLTLGEPPLVLRVAAGDADSASKAMWDEIPADPDGENSQLKFPLAIGLLVRSAAYSQSRSGAVRCFEVQTMKPLITEPPFERALSGMLAGFRPSAMSQLDASVGWPTAGDSVPTAVAALPIAEKVYLPLRDVWEPNESEEPVTVLGAAGRSMSVTRATRNSASAFKLLRWLASDEIAQQISPRSGATLWFRKDQERQASKWLPEGTSDEVVGTFSDVLSSKDCFLIPRIPGIDGYLEALDVAIKAAIAEDRSADEALAAAAERWNALTDQLGRDEQQAAYRKHLGIAASGGE